MQYSKNPKIINQYFGTQSPLYYNYDSYSGIIQDYLYEKRLTKASKAILRVRMIHTSIMHIGAGRFTNQMGIVLSAERCYRFRQIPKVHSYNDGAMSPRVVTKILNKRRYIFNSRHKNKTIVHYKRYSEEHIWLKKHKLM